MPEPLAYEDKMLNSKFSGKKVNGEFFDINIKITTPKLKDSTGIFYSDVFVSNLMMKPYTLGSGFDPIYCFCSALAAVQVVLVEFVESGGVIYDSDNNLIENVLCDIFCGLTNDNLKLLKKNH
jgi:hypothetical protein